MKKSIIKYFLIMKQPISIGFLIGVALYGLADLAITLTELKVEVNCNE